MRRNFFQSLDFLAFQKSFLCSLWFLSIFSARLGSAIDVNRRSKDWHTHHEATKQQRSYSMSGKMNSQMYLDDVVEKSTRGTRTGREKYTKFLAGTTTKRKTTDTTITTNTSQTSDDWNDLNALQEQEHRQWWKKRKKKLNDMGTRDGEGER